MKYVIAFLVVIILAGAGVGYVYSVNRAAAISSAASVPTATVTRQDVEKTVTANGKVASNRDVDIKCQASGSIQTLPYNDVSIEVKPGDLLCQLDPKDMKRLEETAQAVVDADKARLDEARLNKNIAQMSLETARQRAEANLSSSQAKAADAKAKAARVKELFDSNLASKEDLETAMTTATQTAADVESAKAAIAELNQTKLQIDAKEQQIKEMMAALDQDQKKLETAQQNMAYCTVTAPQSDDEKDPPRWFISSLLTNIAPGYIVQSGTSGFSAGTTIMTLSDLSHVYVLASVDESDIGEVIDPARGGARQKVRIQADSFPGQTFEGEVVRVATKGVNTSNVVTFEVKIEVTSPNRTLLRPEMTATAKIIIDSRENVLTIPVSAFSRGAPEGASNGTATQGAAGAASDAAGGGQAIASDDAPASTQPTTRRGRGRGGRNGGRNGGAARNGPVIGTVTVVKDNGSQEQRTVAVGLTDDENYEVVSGLEEGETVALNKNGSDSRWRGGNRGNSIMPRGFGGGGGRR